jgi:hypothetical protein
MYNTDIPSRAELPSSAQLLRSTLIAATTAAALLVTTILPAEYGIDPTGIGRVLGLTQMGEIKTQLAQEAEQDRLLDQGGTPAAPEAPAAPDQRSSLMDILLSQIVIASASAETLPAETLPVEVAQAGHTDETSVTLAPGEGVEVKMEMRKGAQATYSWKTEGGVVNHDTHGEPYDAPNKTHSYSKGRGVASDQGTLQAAFDGNHGWFWRNRGDGNVTVTLNTSGDYENLKRKK